uniref:Secreted protein n=1 Tax=Oryza glumipatula TaxID=40148 RepID=A0A0D9YDT1_9ORYZ
MGKLFFLLTEGSISGGCCCTCTCSSLQLHCIFPTPCPLAHCEIAVVCTRSTYYCSLFSI